MIKSKTEGTNVMIFVLCNRTAVKIAVRFTFKFSSIFKRLCTVHCNNAELVSD